jgi:hypothetical protein
MCIRSTRVRKARKLLYDPGPKRVHRYSIYDESFEAKNEAP